MRIRKFLCADDSYTQSVKNWSRDSTGEHVQIGYLSIDPERQVLVHLLSEQGEMRGAYITIRRGIRDELHPDFEYVIPSRDAEELLKKHCLKPIIQKTCYHFITGVYSEFITEVPPGAQNWTLAVYGGQNNGLVLNQTVVPDDDLADMKPPPWVGREVTNEDKYWDLSLVVSPYGA